MAGFTEEVFVKPIRKAPNLIEAYSCRMEVLNEVQLDLEKLWQEMDCFRCAFSSPDRLLKRVKIMSGYLRRLIDEYEENLPILKNSRDELSLSELKALRQFVGSTKEGKFRQQYCERYSEAVRLIREDSLRVRA
jgi:hypothetical protein